MILVTTLWGVFSLAGLLCRGGIGWKQLLCVREEEKEKGGGGEGGRGGGGEEGKGEEGERRRGEEGEEREKEGEQVVGKMRGM